MSGEENGREEEMYKYSEMQCHIHVLYTYYGWVKVLHQTVCRNAGSIFR